MLAQPTGPNPLTILLETTRAHWRQHRPHMYAALEKSGKLESALQAAVEQTKAAVIVAVDRMTLWEAWTLYREEWCLLPDEETEVTLKHGDPATWQAPELLEE